jgi:rhodanese-related sulfurtransferase
MKRILGLFCVSSLIFSVSNSIFAATECKLSPGMEEFKTKNEKIWDKDFKGEPLPAVEPIVGTGGYIDTKTLVAEFLDKENAPVVFVDTRPADLFERCQIRGAQNIEYGYLGFDKNAVKKEWLEEQIKAGKTVVFYCNSERCHRSLNAYLEACRMGVDLSKVKWAREGVPGVVKDNPDKYRKYTKGKGCAEFLK